jgi:hypothetical protein
MITLIKVAMASGCTCIWPSNGGIWPNVDSNTYKSWTVLDSVGQCWAVLDSVGQCWTVLDSVGQRRTVLDSVGQCGTVSDSTAYISFKHTQTHTCTLTMGIAEAGIADEAFKHDGRPHRDTEQLCAQIHIHSNNYTNTHTHTHTHICTHVHTYDRDSGGWDGCP